MDPLDISNAHAMVISIGFAWACAQEALTYNVIENNSYFSNEERLVRYSRCKIQNYLWIFCCIRKIKEQLCVVLYALIIREQIRDEKVLSYGSRYVQFMRNLGKRVSRLRVHNAFNANEILFNILLWLNANRKIL